MYSPPESGMVREAAATVEVVETVEVAAAEVVVEVEVTTATTVVTGSLDDVVHGFRTGPAETRATADANATRLRANIVGRMKGYTEMSISRKRDRRE